MQCKDRGKNTRNDKNNRPEKANRTKSQKLVRYYKELTFIKVPENQRD